MLKRLNFERRKKNEGEAAATSLPLTPKEIERLQAYADGETPSSLAILGVAAEGSLKNQRRIIFDKLGADTIAQAVAMGIRRGIIR